jgi:hypothetical protein
MAIALEIAGVLVVAWGMLLVLTLGLTVTGIGASVVFASYGVAVIQADRRAVPLGWMVTILMAVAAFADGLAPVLVLVWCGFFVLSMFLSDSRDRLRRYGENRAETSNTWAGTAPSLCHRWGAFLGIRTVSPSCSSMRSSLRKSTKVPLNT